MDIGNEVKLYLPARMISMLAGKYFHETLDNAKAVTHNGHYEQTTPGKARRGAQCIEEVVGLIDERADRLIG